LKQADLVKQIRKKKSFLSIGLDTDINKIPRKLQVEDDPILSFNKEIIDHTQDLCMSYKINTAFYEVNGWKGWQTLQKTVDYIKENYPEQFVILDAKRGDIGNTSLKYAAAFFDEMKADAVTVAPYMGEDSVSPFLTYRDKYTILLALTSNKGSADFQFYGNERPLYQKVISTALQWQNSENLMLVVGATKPEYFQTIRKLAPDHFFLVPGVGAQGGDLNAVCKYGMNKDIGLIINSSRSIIYASNEDDYAQAARNAAQEMQREMAGYFN